MPVMATKSVTVCDMCGSQDGLITYTIKGDAQFRIDLCRDHQQPIEDLRAVAGATRTRRRRFEVLDSPADIPRT